MKTKLTAMVLAAVAALGAEVLEVSPEFEDTSEYYDDYDNPIELSVRYALVEVGVVFVVGIPFKPLV